VFETIGARRLEARAAVLTARHRAVAEDRGVGVRSPEVLPESRRSTASRRYAISKGDPRGSRATRTIPGTEATSEPRVETGRATSHRPPDGQARALSRRLRSAINFTFDVLYIHSRPTLQACLDIDSLKRVLRLHVDIVFKVGGPHDADPLFSVFCLAFFTV